MVDVEKVLPIVMESFPEANPEEVRADVEAFCAEHPDLSNLEALVALHQALQDESKPKEEEEVTEEPESMPESEDEKLKGVLGL